MKKYLLSFCILLAGIAAQAQNDTVFFDKDWRVTKIRSEMAYFRPLPVKEGEHYKVSDHFIDGTIQMIGHYKIDDPKKLMGLNYLELRDGKFQYFNKGMLSTEGKYELGQKVGVWDEYYDSSAILCKRHNYKKDNDTMTYVYYAKDGSYRFHGMFVDGKKEGVWKRYEQQTGQMLRLISYRNNEMHGDVIHYYSNGIVRRKEYYADGVRQNGNCYDSTGTEVTFFPYWISPKPGYDINKYLVDNVKYPKAARKKRIEGRLFIDFMVDEHGEIKNIKSRPPDAHPSLQEEAIRVVSTMPAWVPGKEDGQNVSIHYSLPINFKLSY